MSYNTLLCIVAMTELLPAGVSESYVDKVIPTYQERLGTCIEVANAAEIWGEGAIKPSQAVSIAYQETAFDGRLVGRAGERGPMQVLPAYTSKECKREGKRCDWVREGIKALLYWARRFPRTPLCHYNGGNRCGKQARSYARAVRRRQHRIASQIKAISFDFENASSLAP